MIGRKIGGRYEIVGELGHGGMGAVYRAWDPDLSRDVAIKLIPPALLSEKAKERFRREAQLVAQMDHPSIVPIFDIGTDEDSLYFLMPVIQGVSLRSFLKKQLRSLRDLLEIGIQVADGLDYSHARGVVHRDVKPENIMISTEEDRLRARIMDFGLARTAEDGRITKAGALVGTTYYFSPEQLGRGTIDGRSDIYSLGTVLYECVAGEPPFTGDTQSVLYRIAHEIPPSLRGMGALIPHELEEILMRSLAKDPAKRYQRASEMATALIEFRARLGREQQDKAFQISKAVTAQYAPPPGSQFIGREKELTSLQRRLHSALEGECQFVVVGGEPGIGKTRLLEEIEGIAQARRIPVLHGRFVERDRTFPYQGFVELIQDYFRSSEGGSSGGRVDLSDLAPELTRLFPALSEISALRSETRSPETAVEVPRIEERTYVYELLARTLTRLAAGRPLVLIMEHLHAAESSIDALTYLVRRLGSTPTLIAATYRQTEVDRKHPLLKMLESFGDDPRFETFVLGPLSTSENRLFIQSLVGEGTLSDGLIETLMESTEAIPFFTKELVKSLAESGGIAKSETGEWTLSRHVAAVADALPDTIQQTVERRMEKLAPELRQVLAVASVIGRSFEFKELEIIADQVDAIDDAIDHLVREGILAEEESRGGDRLMFSSGIVRDVLYGSLSRRKRRTIHRRYAELLESRHAERLDRVFPELVRHFSEGDVPDKTIGYGLELAKRSLESFLPERTVQAAKTVIEFLDETEPDDVIPLADARMLLASAERMLGRLDAALRDAEEAVRLLGDLDVPEKRVNAMILAAEIAWHGREVEGARLWLGRGIELARACEATPALRRLLELALVVASLRGDHEAARELQEELGGLAAAVSPVPTESIPAGGHLLVGLVSPIDANDPATIFIDEESEVLSLVFDSLVETDERGYPSPLLSRSWEVLDDGLRLRVRLRDDVVFHDGVALTSEIVKASFERAIRVRPKEIVPALAVIEGAEAWKAGTTSHLEGMVVFSAHEFELRLIEPLPFYPSMLGDPATGIVREDGSGNAVGTGPFTIKHRDSGAVDLVAAERQWRERPPRLGSVTFKILPNAAEMAREMRAGNIDVGRDFAPEDFEVLLRDRSRHRHVESPKKNTFLVVLNVFGAAGSNESLRQALTGSIDTNDLVWRTLGSLAQPAVGVIPPGIFGHHAGLKRKVLSRERAAELVAASGLPCPIRLVAAAHPLFHDRYRSLLQALLETWREIGVEVTFTATSMSEFIATGPSSDGIDMRVGRWVADFDDPDTFAHGLFNSKDGLFARYYSSPDMDGLLEGARVETRPAVREALYHRFESLLARSAAVLPLFHEVDQRVVGLRVKGFALRSTPPYVNYEDVGVADKSEKTTAVTTAGGGILTVPISENIMDLTPSRAHTVERAEVSGTMFETLTHCADMARIEPWLAAEVRLEEGASRVRIRLRDVKFHDGRRLTARDVRYSWERLLLDASSDAQWLLSPIRGAEAIIGGRSRDLSGVRILTPHELIVELDGPVSFFPALVSHPLTAIVPEGSEHVGSSWRDGTVGTGPFRLVRFEPGRSVELERNPSYWRTGYPRSEGLIFRLGERPTEVRKDFMAGRISIAGELFPIDFEQLIHDPDFAPGYKEMPRLSTYFVAFNAKTGPLADLETRRALIRSIDVPDIVRRTLGRLGTPAHGVVPPGLLGYSPEGPRAPESDDADEMMDVHLDVNVHPHFVGHYAMPAGEIFGALRARGARLSLVDRSMVEFLEVQAAAAADLNLSRWVADYPDTDNFMHGMLHTKGGIIGRFCGSGEIDELVAHARAELDPGSRHVIYRRIEEILKREALVLPLFHEQVYRFARPEVEGLRFSGALPEVRYEYLRIRR